MSLVVCIKATDGIVLAADSRGTIGDPRGLTAINDNQVKIFPMGKCGIGLVGASEIGSSLLDEFHKNGLDKSTSIDEAVAKAVKLSADLFSVWFSGMLIENRPLVILTLVGYRYLPGDKTEPMIYMLASQMNFAPQLLRDTCLSGVPQYAVYLQHRYYDPSICLEKAKALAEYLINETASQDPKVGGQIRMAEISAKNGYQEISKEEVERISKANGELNLKLRQFFIAGGIS